MPSTNRLPPAPLGLEPVDPPLEKREGESLLTPRCCCSVKIPPAVPARLSGDAEACDDGEERTAPRRDLAPDGGDAADGEEPVASVAAAVPEVMTPTPRAPVLALVAGREWDVTGDSVASARQCTATLLPKVRSRTLS